MRQSSLKIRYLRSSHHPASRQIYRLIPSYGSLIYRTRSCMLSKSHYRMPQASGVCTTSPQPSWFFPNVLYCFTRTISFSLFCRLDFFTYMLKRDGICAIATALRQGYKVDGPSSRIGLINVFMICGLERTGHGMAWHDGMEKGGFSHARQRKLRR